MRPTWVVLGLVVGLGAVAYAKLRSKAETAPLARPASDAPASPVAPSDGKKPAEGGQPAGSPSLAAPATSTPPSGVVVIDAARAKENASHADAITRTDGGGRRSLFLFAGLAAAVIAVGAFVMYRRRQLG